MSPIKREVILIVVAVLLLVLAITVFVRSRGFNDHVLAALGILGGIAVVIVALPVGKDK
jgi:hypothetical protein